MAWPALQCAISDTSDWFHRTRGHVTPDCDCFLPHPMFCLLERVLTTLHCNLIRVTHQHCLFCLVFTFQKVIWCICMWVVLAWWLTQYTVCPATVHMFHFECKYVACAGGGNLDIYHRPRKKPSLCNFVTILILHANSGDWTPTTKVDFRCFTNWANWTTILLKRIWLQNHQSTAIILLLCWSFQSHCLSVRLSATYTIVWPRFY